LGGFREKHFVLLSLFYSFLHPDLDSIRSGTFWPGQSGTFFSDLDLIPDP
jgi:hypothetical protein